MIEFKYKDIDDKSVSVALKEIEGDIDDIMIPSSFEDQTVTTISSKAFENCPYVYSFYIPKTIKEIKKDAFKNCDNAILYFEGKKEDYSALKCSLPKYFEVNETNLFKDDFFDFLVVDGGVVITHYLSSEDEVRIPKIIHVDDKEYKVIGLGRKAFNTISSWGIKKIYVPEYLKNIPHDCFYNKDIIERY